MMCTESPVALNSWAACTAPAWMLLQNSCVVPLGTTAMVSDLPAPDAAGLSDFVQGTSPNARNNARVFIRCSTSGTRGPLAVSPAHDSPVGIRAAADDRRSAHERRRVAVTVRD